MLCDSSHEAVVQKSRLIVIYGDTFKCESRVRSIYTQAHKSAFRCGTAAKDNHSSRISFFIVNNYCLRKNNSSQGLRRNRLLNSVRGVLLFFIMSLFMTMMEGGIINVYIGYCMCVQLFGTSRSPI